MVSMRVNASFPKMRGILCARLIPNNFTFRTYNVLGANELQIFINIQHTFHFDLDLIAYQVMNTNTLAFIYDFCMPGGTLCVRLCLNHFTKLHILDANQLHYHCGCATHLSFDLDLIAHPCQGPNNT